MKCCRHGNFQTGTLLLFYVGDMSHSVFCSQILLVEEGEEDNAQSGPGQDEQLDELPPDLEVLANHEGGGVPHCAATQGEQEPVGQEHLEQH